MDKGSAWEAIGRAMAAYNEAENGDPHRVQAVWDAQPRGIRSAIGRRIAAAMGAEWCGKQGDPFNRFLAYVEKLVAADRAIFPAVKTPEVVAPAAKPIEDLIAELMDAGTFDSRFDLTYIDHANDRITDEPVLREWIIRLLTPEPAPISGGSPVAEAAGRASTLALLRDGLDKLRGAYRLWPCEATAGLIRQYEEAVTELETPPAPPTPKPLARGGQHARPATDAGDPIVGICGFSYRITAMPIHSSVGSHAFAVRDLDRNRVHHVCRDLFGQPDCTCGDHVFRRAGNGEPCKHAAKLMEMGLMPISPRVLPPLASRPRRFEPTPEMIREAAALAGA